MGSAKQLKNGMAAEKIVLFPMIQQPAKNIGMIATSNVAMVKANLVIKSPRSPAFVLRSEQRDEVNPSGTDYRISAYFFKTPPTKHLAGTGDVVRTFEPLVVYRIVLNIGSAAHAESRILRKLCKEEFKIIGSEGHIRIQISNHIVIQAFNSSVPRIKCRYFPGKTALSSDWKSYQFYPIVGGCVSFYDVISAISRTVADDDPLHGSKCLSDDRSDGLLDELGLVSRRRDEDVGARSATNYFW
jgi:hypothetical protein